MSDGKTKPATLYAKVCQVLDTHKTDEETDDDFKIRVAQEINAFSDEEWEELDEAIKMWIDSVTNTLARNLTKTRPQAIPGLPGLDTTSRRYDITRPLPQKVPTGRKRGKGDDVVTRVMTILAGMDNPENVKVDEIRTLVTERFNASYSDTALKQAAAAFNIARSVLGVNQTQAAA